MSTEAQCTANQANAKHSTGPTSPQGKAVSCQNNLRHGFTGSFTLLSWEDPKEFEDLQAQLTLEHAPSTITEHLLTEKMAQSWWLRMRALMLQNTCFNNEAECDREKQLALYLRYQTTHDRAFHKALSELLKLRTEKRKQEIGFVSQQQKEAAAAHRQSNENRKQERHKWHVLLAQAKLDNQELQNLALDGSADRVEAGIQRIRAAEKAA